MSTRSLLSASFSTNNSRLVDDHPNVTDPIAAERWNVEKKRIEIDAEIESFYNGQVAKCINIENISNKKAVKLYNDLFYKIKWSNPPIPAVHGRLMIAYCGHLLNVGSKIAFENEVDMHVWSRKAKGTSIDKVTMECTGMCNRMFKIIDKRDSDIAKTQLKLLDTTDKMNIKKDGTLRYMMEKNHNARDNYFSIWYLATHNKTRELGVLLTSASKMANYDRGVDTPDPDFGLTALLYAVKNDHWNAFQLLLEHGANYHIRAPDGRTALHYAAAYSSKEMLLELLGLGLGYEATDNYGCTALDVAKQNVNKRTYNVLLNWNHLVPAVSNEMGDEGVASFTYAGGSSIVSHMTPSEYLISKGIGMSRPEQQPSVTFTPSLNEEKFPMIENLEESYAADPPPLMYPEGSNVNLENSFVYADNGSSNSMGMYIPDEYTMTPETTIEQMSPMLRLLTKRLEACNKFLDRKARTGRAEESATYFLKRSVGGMDLIHQSMCETLSRSSQVLVHQQQLLQMSRSNMQLSSVESGVFGEPLGEVQPNLEMSTEVVPSVNDNNASSSEQLVVSQVDQPDSAVLDQPTESLVESEWPGDDGVDEEEEGEAMQPAEQFVVNTASTMKLIEQEVHECLIEIRQCTKHYHMCVREGFLLEALKSLKRRWLVSKELLVLHGRKEQFLMEEWTTLHQAASVAEEQEQDHLPQIESSTVADVPVIVANVDETNNVEQPDKKDDDSELFLIRTNDQESEANMLRNSQYDRVDLGRLALNFEESLRRVVFMPDDEENDMFEHKEEADGLKTNSIASNQYLEDRRWGKFVHSELPVDRLQVSEIVHMKSVTSSSSSEVGGGGSSPQQNKTVSKAFKSSVRYIDGGYEQVTPTVHSSYEPTGSASESDDKSVVSRGVVTSNLSKDVLKLGEHSNIYYEAAEYVSKMKEHRDISALELIQAINEQAKNRRLIYQPNKSSIAASTTITATQSQARDDALSISSRGDTITTTFTTAAESIVSNFGKSQISVRYLLTQGLELCDTHLTRREEGSAVKVMEECCLLLDPTSELSHTTNDVDVTMKIKLLTRKCDLLLSVYRYLSTDTHLKSTSATRETETERALSMWRGVQYQPILESTANTSLTVSGPGGEAVCSDPAGWDCNLLLSRDWIKQNIERIVNQRRERALAAERLRQQQREQQLLLESENPIAPPPSLVTEPSLNASIEESHILIVQEESTELRNGSSVIELMSGQASGVNLENSHEIQPVDGSALVSFEVSTTAATEEEEVMLAAEQEELTFFEQLQQHREAVLDNVLTRIVVAAKLSIHLHHELYSHDIVEPFTLAQALQFIAFVHDYRIEGPEALVFMQHAEIIAVRSLGGGSEETIKVALESLRLFVKYYLLSQEDVKFFYGKCNEVLRYIKDFSRSNIKSADALNKQCTELLALSTIIASGGGVFDPAVPKIHRKLTISACNNHAIMKKYSTGTYRKQFFPFR